MLTGQEVAQHASQDDLWMVIQGNAYNLTEFAPSHPGGLKILLKYAGKDATEEYEPIHPPGTIEEALKKEFHLGPVDMSTVEKVVVQEVKKPIEGAINSLEECLNLNDIEIAAESRLKTKAWAYYASAADDEFTKNHNNSIYKKIRFRPRVLVDVTEADLSTTILGQKSSLPFFIAPAALAKLAHPEGEHLFARVAGKAGIPYMVSANASISYQEIASQANLSEQTLFYQVYVNKDRKKTEEQLKKVKELGYKAVCVTVDAPVAGKRERDERSKMDADSANDPGMKKAASDNTAVQGIANTMGAYVDPRLSWTDLSWISRVSSLPLIVKGIQCAEDAALCALNGVSAIYLSNHGGRQLDGANTPMETLMEIRKYEPWVFDKCEVYVDGGIRRGTDILKAIALGAKAVGVGRPYMYSLTFGEAGVAVVTNILKAELEQNLRLLGASKLSELNPSMVNTRELESNMYDGYVSPVKRGFWSKL